MAKNGHYWEDLGVQILSERRSQQKKLHQLPYWQSTFPRWGAGPLGFSQTKIRTGCLPPPPRGGTVNPEAISWVQHPAEAVSGPTLLDYKCLHQTVASPAQPTSSQGLGGPTRPVLRPGGHGVPPHAQHSPKQRSKNWAIEHFPEKNIRAMEHTHRPLVGVRGGSGP